MTLSLDDVRNKRFRMARKSGYEVLEVDEFVDEVEESFGQLIEENQNLKKQVESLKSSAAAPSAASTPPKPQGETAGETATEAQPSELSEIPEPKLSLRASAPNAIVVTTGKEASTAVVRLVEMSTEQAERLVDEANEDANRIREEANRTAHQVTTDALTRAERVEAEARVNAERVQADALGRAETLDRDIESRRAEMFGELEKQRDDLTATVSALRNFEAAYRSNLTDHLRSQIESLETGSAQPTEVPDVIRDLPASEGPAGEDGSAASEDDEDPSPAESSPTSNTPRLDALLGDQR